MVQNSVLRPLPNKSIKFEIYLRGRTTFCVGEKSVGVGYHPRHAGELRLNTIGETLRVASVRLGPESCLVEAVRDCSQ